MTRSDPPVIELLDAFRAHRGITTPDVLREAFFTQPKLVGEAATFCREYGVVSSKAQVLAALLGVGPLHFHHLESHLRDAYQADMPSLANLVEREIRTTHALQRQDPHGLPQIPWPA